MALIRLNLNGIRVQDFGDNELNVRHMTGWRRVYRAKNAVGICAASAAAAADACFADWKRIVVEQEVN